MTLRQCYVDIMKRRVKFCDLTRDDANFNCDKIQSRLV